MSEPVAWVLIYLIFNVSAFCLVGWWKWWIEYYKEEKNDCN